MAASPGKKRKLSMTIWVKLNRFINFILGLLLIVTAYLQIPRADAVVWVAIFFVPAAVTLITSFRLQLGGRAEVKVVVSVHVACCLCLLMYLGIRLIHGMAHQQANILILDGEGNPKSSFNPLDYREGWEILAVIMVVAWMKFLAMTTREHIKESGLRESDVSPLWMLQAMAAVIVVPLALASFCYIEGVNTAAKTVYSLFNKITDPSHMTDPIPPIYNPVAQPQKDLNN